MAVTKVKHTWSHFADLVSTDGSKTWKVQRNELGQFRCSCPSFIFSKLSPKSCKHCRKCEETLAEEQMKKGPAATPQAVAAQKPAVAPHWDTALTMFDAMCLEATKTVRFNVRNQIGLSACKVMVDVLAARLAVFVPPVAVHDSSIDDGGVRRITFDD